MENSYQNVQGSFNDQPVTMDPEASTQDTSLITSNWFVITIDAITIPTLVFLLSGLLLVIYHTLSRKHQPKGLNLQVNNTRQQQQQQEENPHSFGTHDWLVHEMSGLSRQERDAIHIASLEAEVRMLEESTDVLDPHCVDLLGGRNRLMVEELAQVIVYRRYRQDDGVICAEAQYPLGYCNGTPILEETSTYLLGARVRNTRHRSNHFK